MPGLYQELCIKHTPFNSFSSDSQLSRALWLRLPPHFLIVLAGVCFGSTCCPQRGSKTIGAWCGVAAEGKIAPPESQEERIKLWITIVLGPHCSSHDCVRAVTPVGSGAGVWLWNQYLSKLLPAPALYSATEVDLIPLKTLCHHSSSHFWQVFSPTSNIYQMLETLPRPPFIFSRAVVWGQAPLSLGNYFSIL